MENIALAAFGLTIETTGTVVIDTKEFINLKITFPERKDAAEIRATLTKREEVGYVLENVYFTDYLQGEKNFSLGEIHSLCNYLVHRNQLLQPFYAMIYNAHEIEKITTEE